MPLLQEKSLVYWTFDSLKSLPLRHAVFTRHGGVSTGHLQSLNLSRAVGDSEAHVRTNEEKIFEVFKRPLSSTSDSLLEHGTHAIYANNAFASRNGKERKADILMTDRIEITLFMRFADCPPILFYDESNHAIALTHAGWKGTVSGVATKTIEAMNVQFGTQVKNLIVTIGPGICASHYEVGEEVVDALRKSYPKLADRVLPSSGAGKSFDLALANQLILENAGVKKIEQSGICTAENLSDWFSHRGEMGKTGRFAVLMALEAR